MAILIRANGTEERLLKTPDSAEARELLNCDCVESVFPRRTPNAVLIVDESGHCKGLAINARASDLYGGPIAGDVICLQLSEASYWLAT